MHPEPSTRGTPRTLAVGHQCLQGRVMLGFAGLLKMLNLEMGITLFLSFRQWIYFHGCPMAERCSAHYSQAGWQPGGLRLWVTQHNLVTEGERCLEQSQVLQGGDLGSWSPQVSLGTVSLQQSSAARGA